jgi:hypothetical protein
MVAPFFFGRCLGKRGHEPVAPEDVVAQDQGDAVVFDEFLSDDEGLGNALGLRLHGIGNPDTPLRTVGKQPFERVDVLRRRDDEYVLDAGKHEDCERIIHHGLVIHRDELLA